MDKQLNWISLLAPDIAGRLRTAGDTRAADIELAARAIVATALTCLSLAAEAWAAQDGAVDIAVLFDSAIAAVRGNVRSGWSPRDVGSAIVRR
jgi:hypothetical protein